MAGTTRIDFVTGGTNNGSFTWTGGKLMFFITAGTWGGGNVQVQQNFNGTWMNVGTAVTTNGSQEIELAPGLLQVVVTTATGVNASAVSVPTVING